MAQRKCIQKKEKEGKLPWKENFKRTKKMLGLCFEICNNLWDLQGCNNKSKIIHNLEDFPKETFKIVKK